MIIRLLSPKSRERENAWWATLTDEQKQAEIDRRNKEDRGEEIFKSIIGVVAIMMFVLVPMTMVIWKIWFEK